MKSSVEKQIDEQQKTEFLALAQFNLSRGDARTLMANLIREIEKTGGERQRSEGVRILEGARKHILGWVD